MMQRTVCVRGGTHLEWLTCAQNVVAQEGLQQKVVKQTVYTVNHTFSIAFSDLFLACILCLSCQEVYTRMANDQLRKSLRRGICIVK